MNRAAAQLSAFLTAAICGPLVLAAAATACPFCDALQPTFAERRAEADVVIFAEATSRATFRVLQVPQGRDEFGDAATVAVAPPRDAGAEKSSIAVGGLALLLGRRIRESDWLWDVVEVNEVSAAYFLRLPDSRQPAVDRLRYCAKFLEHADPAIAEDAYAEFGRASFDDVRAAADALPFESLRRWMLDPAVPERRKGFYGLALGLARDEAVLRENTALLRRLIALPASEFRAGFDGVLGGLLTAEGAAALDLIDRQILTHPQAAEGDVRHAQKALQFYLQYGRDVPDDRLAKSLTLLLDRPAAAPGALADLTRRRDWTFVARSEKLFVDSPGDDPALDRAVVGYLLVCPKPEAAAALRRLREAHPRRYAEGEYYWATLGIQPRSGD